MVTCRCQLFTKTLLFFPLHFHFITSDVSPRCVVAYCHRTCYGTYCNDKIRPEGSTVNTFTSTEGFAFCHSCLDVPLSPRDISPCNKLNFQILWGLGMLSCDHVMASCSWLNYDHEVMGSNRIIKSIMSVFFDNINQCLGCY